MGLQIYDEHAPDNANILIDDSDGTTPKAFYYGAPSGSRIDRIVLSSTAVIPHDILLFLFTNNSAPLCCATIPAGAGYTPAVPPVELIALLPAGMDGIIVGVGQEPNLQLLVGLGAGEVIYGTVQGGDF